ncbi:hypothetical protein H0H93_015943, partial [Arthromyces matolae]
ASEEEEIKRIRQLFPTAPIGKIGSLHNSLYISLALSPLLLLVSRNYGEIASREDMLINWQGIGGLHKPHEIVESEKIIWKALITSASSGDVMSNIRPAVDQLHTFEKAIAPMNMVDVGSPQTEGTSSTGANISEAGPSLHGTISDTSSAPRVNDLNTTAPNQSNKVDVHKPVPFPINASSKLSSQRPANLQPPIIQTLQERPIETNTSDTHLKETSPRTLANKDIDGVGTSNHGHKSIVDYESDQEPPLENNASGRSNVDGRSLDGSASPIPNTAHDNVVNDSNNEEPLDQDKPPIGDNTTIPGAVEHPANSELSGSANKESTETSGADSVASSDGHPGQPPAGDNAAFLDAVGGPPHVEPSEVDNDALTDDEGHKDPLSDRSMSPASNVTDADSDDAGHNDDRKKKNRGKKGRTTNGSKDIRRSGRLGNKDIPSTKGTTRSNSKGHKKRKGSQKPKVTIKEEIIELEHDDFVDLNDEVPLDLTTQVESYDVQDEIEFRVTGSDDKIHVKPSFHINTDLSLYNSLYLASKETKKMNAVCVLSSDEFQSLDSLGARTLLKSYACIVSVNLNHRDEGFTKHFTLFSEQRTRKGTPNDLLISRELNPPRALSALSLPATRDTFPNVPFSSDVEAWSRVRDAGYFSSKELYPVQDMRFSIAGTDSSSSYWHVDADGVGTWIYVECGFRLWYIGTPKSGNWNEFSDFSEMFGNNYDLSECNLERWDIHLVVLGPGSTIVMRPCLPHAVMTVKSSIARGGHFYNSSTLLATINGLYFGFLANGTLTNATHVAASHKVLSRLLALFHLELTTPDGSYAESGHLLDWTVWSDFFILMSFCTYFELYSSTIGWAYDELDDGSYSLFKSSIRNRSMARQIMHHFFENYRLEGPDGFVAEGLTGLQTIYCNQIVHHANLLIDTAKVCEEDGFVSDARAFLKGKKYSLEEAFLDSIRGGPAASFYMGRSTPSADTDFAWNRPTLEIRKLTSITKFDFPFVDGLVYGDLRTAHRLEVSIASMSSREIMDDIVPESDSDSESAEESPAITDDVSKKRNRSTSIESEASMDDIQCEVLAFTFRYPIIFTPP